MIHTDGKQTIANAPRREPDFGLRNEGTLALLTPVSDAAREWADEHLPEDATVFGQAIVVEPRYIIPIVEGILNDGLKVAA